MERTKRAAGAWGAPHRGRRQRRLAAVLATTGLCWAVAPAVLPAADGVPVDMSSYQRPAGWDCHWCPRDQGANGDVAAGVGYASDSSFKFGRFTGLNEQGGYFLGDASARYSDGGAHYWEAQGSNLGLDSRSVSGTGGRQGKYRATLEYDEIPFYLAEDGRTPLLRRQENVLVLPDDWVPAPLTQQMPNLNADLRPVELQQKRKRIGAGAAFLPTPQWELSVHFTHEKKDGTRTLGGIIGPAFGAARATILPEPVDYDTDQVDAAASYSGRHFQAKFGYYGSFFKDHNSALTWQNPFVAADSPAANGRLALPPDNQFHQMYASLGYDLLKSTRASAYFAFGRMTQDEEFLPFTINPTLGGPLPRSSPDAKVGTTVVDLKLNSRPLTKLQLNGRFLYNNRDNDTPQALYDYVIADSAPAPVPRTNLPYSFKRRLYSVDGGYALPLRSDLSLGYDYDTIERTFQAVDQTKEDTFWGTVKLKPHEKVDISLKYANSRRDGSAYRLVEETVPSQNPLLRKFYMADRDRNAARATVHFTPNALWSFGFAADYADDDYTNSPVGLTSAKDASYSLDLNFTPGEVLSSYAFFTHQSVKSQQAGSANFAAPDWFASAKDRFDTVGLGVQWAAIKDTLDLGAQYVYAYSRGKIEVDNLLVDATPLPNLTTRLNSVSLYAKYRFDKKLSLRLGYLYENYNSADWAVDGVAPDTLASVLSLGVQSPDYSVSFYSASLIYDF